jgi:hypothetical protein
VRVSRLKSNDVGKVRKGLSKLIAEEMIPTVRSCVPKTSGETEVMFFDESFNHIAAKLQNHIRKRLKVMGL